MASIFSALPAVIGKVAQGAVNSAVNAAKKNSGGTSSNRNTGSASSTNRASSTGSGSSRPQTTSSSPAGGYTEKYTGGIPELDAAIKEQSDRYFAAKAAGDATGMREANDRANQLRNQYGYAAEFATQDINAVAQANGGGSPGYSYSSSIYATSPVVNDYSSYIEAMNRAQQEAAREQLRAAYEQNLAALKRTQQQIPIEYQNARNQAAAQSAVQQQNFNEYAAAQGLNSGTGGQAQLAFRNALQGDLSSLSQEEASSLADLELQRTQAEIDYNNAIAQAEANGNYQLAQQLYSEKVRVDEALREQMIWQAQQEFQQLQFDTANDQWQQQFDFSREQYDRGLLEQRAATLAQAGDFSGYRDLGYSDEEIAAMENYYTTLANRSSSTGSSGGGGGGYDPVFTTSQLLSAINNGTPFTPQMERDFEAQFGISYDEYINGPENMEDYRSIIGERSETAAEKILNDLSYRKNFRGESNERLLQALATLSNEYGLPADEAREIALQLNLM